MGVLRLLLAISVVIVHAGPVLGLRLLDGVTAVQGFFVISGFYMAMILNEKYDGPGGTARFYRNRFLRIYPLYWLALGTALVVFALVLLLPGDHHNAVAALLAGWQSLGFGRLVFLLVSNVALIGLDWGLFFPFSAPDGSIASASMYQLVPQAWSLGIEVVVYCLSPWLFRRSPWLIAAVAAASFVARAIGYNYGLRTDPWDYRFFPFELGLFCLGALAYRVAPTWFRRDSRARIAGALLLLLLIFAFPNLPDGPAFLPGFRVDQLAFLAVMIIAIAPVFELSKRSRWDRAIGDLSYPLYLIHLLVIQVLANHAGYGNLLPLAVSLALAWGMARLLAPVERIRQRGPVAQVLRPATQLEG